MSTYQSLSMSLHSRHTGNTSWCHQTTFSEIPSYVPSLHNAHFQTDPARQRHFFTPRSSLEKHAKCRSTVQNFLQDTQRMHCRGKISYSLFSVRLRTNQHSCCLDTESAEARPLHDHTGALCLCFSAGLGAPSQHLTVSKFSS